MNLTTALEILDRIMKSWWTVVAGICLGLSAATGALYYMPKVYEAGTTIFVVPPQMPGQLFQSTVTDDMSTRLSALREAVISRPYMVQLINRTYGEIEDEERLEQMINSIASRVVVSLMRIDPRRGGGVFQLSFRSGDPEKAAETINNLASLYIQQNIQFRTDQAQETAETIKELADEVEVQLRTLEKEIAAFKEQHLYDTSDHFDANLQQMSASRQELESNGRAIAAANDRLQALLLQQEQADLLAATMPETAQPSADPIRTAYIRLRGELADLRARYQEDHPDVRRKKKEFDDFVAENAAYLQVDPEEGEPSENIEPVVTPLMAQIDSARREIERLEADEARIQDDIEEYKRRIERTPRVDQALTELTKNHGVLQDKYRDYQEKYEDAKAALRIEQAQQGERFEIIEEARPPMLPIKPVPAIVYGMGLIGGLVLFVGPIVLKYFFVPTINSEAGLKAVSEFPIFITLNQLQTPAIIRTHRRLVFKNILASTLSVLVLAAVAVVYYWKIYL
jgi:polysaccharide chain length determinant protein (PEP-CTERM system associated)